MYTYSLEGKKISGFNGVKKAVKGALEEGLTRICEYYFMTYAWGFLDVIFSLDACLWVLSLCRADRVILIFIYHDAAALRFVVQIDLLPT